MSEAEDLSRDVDGGATPAPAPTIARPASCAAHADDDLMVCHRCGLEWPAGAPGPKCNPITFERLRARMLQEVTRAEASLIAVHAVRLNGGPADPSIARLRVAELEAIQCLVDRVTLDGQMRDMLNRKK